MDSPNLSNFLDITSDKTVDFCHLDYERNTLHPHEVWADIFIDASQEDTSLHVVCSDAIARRYPIIRAWQDLGATDQTPPLRSYKEFLRHAHDCWSDPEHMMNQKTIFVIDIDPHMSVDCAMALVAAAQLAMDRVHYSKTRLLTVSCGTMERALVRLAQHHGLSRPKVVIRGDSSWRESQPEDFQVMYCESVSEVAKRFMERSTNIEGKHVLFEGPECGLSSELTLDETWEMSIPPSNGGLDGIWKAFNATSDKNMLVYVPQRFYSPFPLSGYDHVHLVVQTQTKEVGFDFTVGQTTGFRRQRSSQERCELKTIITRLGTKPSSATLYVIDDYERPDDDEWWDIGTAVHRQDVWNRYLGAFMVAAASLGPRVDAAAVVACFVPEGMHALYHMMAYRLQIQGILKWGEDQRLVLDLGSRELLAFHAVLPFVQYDHRLAYFIAKESQTGSDSLRQTKIQLAAVINSGGIGMFNFEESLGQSRDTLQDVIGACSGYSQPLSDMGNMWLALGLWKRLAQHTQSFQKVFNDEQIDFPKPLWVTAYKAQCIEALQSWKDISSALEASGIETTMQRFDDECILSADECYEVQTHLFSAYLSQLTWCCRGKNGTGKPELYDISSKRVIDHLGTSVSLTIDIDKVADVRPAFGIYHSLLQMNGEVMMSDWTMVPFDIVSRWVEEFQDRARQPGLGIEAMLRTDSTPRPNYDDMDE